MYRGQLTLTISFIFCLLLISGSDSSESVAKQRLNTRLKRMSFLIDDGQIAGATEIAESIGTAISLKSEIADINTVFEFIKESHHQTVHFRSGQNVYYRLLWDICNFDDDETSDIRLIHWIALKDLVIDVMGRSEERLSKSNRTDRYHDKYRECIIVKLLALFDRIDQTTISGNDLKWKTLLNDAVSLQKMQPIRGGKMDQCFQPMIERLYLLGIKLFIRDIEGTELPTELKAPLLHSKLQWIHDHTCHSSLEHCLSLNQISRDPEIECFLNLTQNL